ncbi:YgaB family protein [Mangrovibacillus cuniculi]|uniref:YgaB-like protein n=1 Tax=Mangrovibacillus cuniculi TaxID=2593652 RepID=A0A7S8HEW0_9BACI|nr:YgaB family protein [Mangrovibacillus cuniculi]QPC45785.1 hypothetical protein G8O30_01750 [Mangrovibacillus cuniculi]
MSAFQKVVSAQMETMSQLLYLQGELERCQEVEKQLSEINEADELGEVQNEINLMKEELRLIQQEFEEQTALVIETYKELNQEKEHEITVNY